MREFKTPKVIAVEDCGFHGEAIVYKKKGETWILLSYEQRMWIWNAIPRDHRFRLDRLKWDWPRRFLGYVEGADACQPRAIPFTNAEDLLLSARDFYDTLLGIDLVAPFDYRNGTAVVVALCQVAAGETPTGRSAPHVDCSGECGGRGTIGDYARGTGRICAMCDGSGMVRDVEACERVGRALVDRVLSTGR